MTMPQMNINPPELLNPRVMAIGESITAGQPPAGFPPIDSWVSLANDLLPDVEFRNRAQSGSSAVDWSPRYSWAGLKHFPHTLEDIDHREEIVCVGLGGADAIGWGAPNFEVTSPLFYSAAMQNIVESLLSARSDRVVVLMGPLNHPRLNVHFNTRIDTFRAHNRWFSDQWDSVLFVQPEMAEEHYEEKDVHPNQLGQIHLANTITPVITEGLNLWNALYS